MSTLLKPIVYFKLISQAIKKAAPGEFATSNKNHLASNNNSKDPGLLSVAMNELFHGNHPKYWAIFWYYFLLPLINMFIWWSQWSQHYHGEIVFSKSSRRKLYVLCPNIRFKITTRCNEFWINVAGSHRRLLRNGASGLWVVNIDRMIL